MSETTLIGALAAGAVILVLLLLFARRRQSAALRSHLEQVDSGSEEAAPGKEASPSPEGADGARPLQAESEREPQAVGTPATEATGSKGAAGAETAPGDLASGPAARSAAPQPASQDGAATDIKSSPAGTASGEEADPSQTERASADGPDTASKTSAGTTTGTEGATTGDTADGPTPKPATDVDVHVDVDADAEAKRRQESIGAYKKGLQSTRGGFIARLAKLFKGKTAVDAALLEELEEILITADVGVRTSDRILSAIRTEMESGKLDGDEAVWKLLKEEAERILAVEAPPMSLDHRPSLILVAGVNGVGKTTTIGKLASKYAAEGRKVLLAAGDTYRAAAVLQLEVWGQRVGCPVIKGKEGADPGSVIFDAITRAREERYDLVIADTAGRLHTKQPLMEELRKVDRTITKALGGRGADEILLVLDATTGQNAVQQVHMFKEALAISGVVLTKLDGTAKGGVILGIVDEHKVPVRFVGLGERVEDLRVFDAPSFVAALFERPGGETLAA